MNAIDAAVIDAVLADEKKSRMLLDSMLSRGVKINVPASSLTHADVVAIVRKILADLADREAL